MSLQQRFQDLDHFLTNKVKAVQSYPQDASKAMGDNIVYLSDGGYSRLYGQFDQSDTWTYVLGSESTREVKALFAMLEARLMVEAICTEINEQIQEMEA